MSVPLTLLGLLERGPSHGYGTTVILVTHDARVAAYAGREVVVRDGKVGTLTGATP
jgi:ABC-type lipoprotein export system ATPase subunit